MSPDHVTVVQVSDLHLGDAGGEARSALGSAHWTRFRTAIELTPPDVVVISGDVVVEDPDDDRDQDAARARIARLDVPTLIVPGNHDVGDHPIRTGLPADWHGKPVTAERVSAWERRWGPSFWLHDVGRWRIIGLNAQILGSGTPHERAQWDWLETIALAPDNHRPAVVFLHESLLPRPDHHAPDIWMSVPAAASGRLARLCTARGVRLVGSGHTHRHREWTLNGIRQVTAPSLAGPIVPVRDDMLQPDGDDTPGWLVHRLYDDGSVDTHRHALGAAIPAGAPIPHPAAPSTADPATPAREHTAATAAEEETT